MSRAEIPHILPGSERSSGSSHGTAWEAGLWAGRGENRYLCPFGSCGSCRWQPTSACLFTDTDSSGTSSPGSAGPARRAQASWRRYAAQPEGQQPAPRAGFHSASAEPSLFGGQQKANPTLPLA